MLAKVPGLCDSIRKLPAVYRTVSLIAAETLAFGREALLDSNALRQVSRLVDVGAAENRHVVGEKL